MPLAKPLKAELVDSRTPASEAKLLGAEWAAVREPTKEERARLGIPRNRLATAFVFRTCGGYRVLLLWQDKPRPFLSGLTTAGALGYLAGKHKLTFDSARSALALSAALAMVPDAIGHLALERPAGEPCHRCTCIWSEGGPFDFDSECARTIRAFALSSETIRRTAA